MVNKKCECSFLRQVIFKMEGDVKNNNWQRADNDIKFLSEIKKRLDKAVTDPTEMQMVNQMIDDWVSSLEKEREENED